MSEPPLLGRCREQDCNFALFAAVDQVQSVETWKDARQIGVPYRVGNYGLYARCANGHKVFKLSRVKGTYSKDHNCDARCLNAKGNDCTCSCGGANHGRGHAITVTATPAPEAAHIGEVGKRIRGTATVLGVREVRGGETKLYTFATRTGAQIKWFVPIQYDPGFEQGAELTFSAKVKAHEDGDWGKATVVTYLEQIQITEPILEHA